MSIDTSAHLGYGWMIEADELTPEFYLNRESDFARADNMLDTDYGYDLVTWIDSYREDSPVFIGVPINTTRSVPDKESWHYENITPDELASAALHLLTKTQELNKLHCIIMGKPPKIEATIHLFECTY